jgi:hypothetical protein
MERFEQYKDFIFDLMEKIDRGEIPIEVQNSRKKAIS